MGFQTRLEEGEGGGSVAQREKAADVQHRRERETKVRDMTQYR